MIHWPAHETDRLRYSPVFCLIVAGALPMGLARNPETGMHHGAHAAPGGEVKP